MISYSLRRFYVYVLIDSGTNQIFYVGKGKGQRVFSHMKEWRKGIVSNARKFERITRIYEAGYAVLEKCLADDLAESDAYELERQIIEAIGINNLTNIKDGTGRLCKPKAISAEMAEYLSRRAAKLVAERAELVAMHNITVESLHLELDEAIEVARRNGHVAAMNRAIAAKSSIRAL